jgi:hypothetical protein
MNLEMVTRRSDMNAAKKLESKKLTATVTITVPVDEGWVEFVTGGPKGYVDIFFRDYCGYWLTGIKHDPKRGWLAYEHADEDRPSTDAEKKAALAAWKSGTKLPKNFHVLDEALVLDSWAAGVERSGVDWYENGDANDYDLALQKALLGEIVYG